MEKIRTIALLLALLTLTAAPSTAQNVRDSRGNDFWLTFLPNDRNLSGSDPSLHIMITAQTAASGVVYATRRDGTVRQIAFSIAQPNDVVVVALTPHEHELRGGNYGNKTIGDAETVLKTTVHITADTDVSVYAETREITSTDAWLVLPTDALGTEYRVLSYASFAYLNIPTQSVAEGFPSQFVVIATEDNTRVDIDLSPGRSSVSNVARRSVTLQAGEVYLVQAAMTFAESNDDLTGTRVRASKPVAVLCGHFRAQIPLIDPTQGTRDFLIEQVPSVDTWGKQCVIVPPIATADQQLFGDWDHSVCRILASTDNTTVNANGTMYSLSAGEHRDIPLTEPILVDATNPVLCAIVYRTTNRDPGGVRSGDPFLLVVPPQEQFQQSYTVACVEPRPQDPYFSEHWITAIVPLAAEPSLILDGMRTAALIPIPGTTLGFVHANVFAGGHTMSCDSAFGIYIYGYGRAESYGYTGGMSFDHLFQPTVVLRVHNLYALPGKLDTMMVTIDHISDAASFAAYGANLLTFDMAWNASMYVPRNSGSMSLSGTEASITATFSFDSLNIGDTLVKIAGYHALGTEETDSLLLHNPIWQSANNDTINIITIVRNGYIQTEGVCFDGGVRLFDPLAQRATPSIRVNTSPRKGSLTGMVITYDQHGSAFLQCTTPNNKPFVADIYDALGRLVQRCNVPAHSSTPLPLHSAPYEPRFVHP